MNVARAVNDGMRKSKALAKKDGRIHRSGMSTKELTAHALKLPPKSRARLAAQLLESIDARHQATTDAVWAGEAEARIDAHDRGEEKTVTAAEVLAYRGKR